MFRYRVPLKCFRLPAMAHLQCQLSFSKSPLIRPKSLPPTLDERHGAVRATRLKRVIIVRRPSGPGKYPPVSQGRIDRRNKQSNGGTSDLFARLANTKHQRHENENKIRPNYDITEQIHYFRRSAWSPDENCQIAIQKRWPFNGGGESLISMSTSEDTYWKRTFGMVRTCARRAVAKEQRRSKDVALRTDRRDNSRTSVLGGVSEWRSPWKIIKNRYATGRRKNATDGDHRVDRIIERHCVIYAKKRSPKSDRSLHRNLPSSKPATDENTCCAR